MGNEITTPFGGAIQTKDKADLARRAAQSADEGARGGAPSGSDYMNFSGKRGMYTIGQDKRRIEDDELWVLNIMSFEDGWVCWKGGKPAAQRLANIYGDAHPVTPPAGDEGGPFDSGRGEGWFRAKAWVVKSLDNDQQGYFKINSVSGVGEMSDLIGEVAQRMGSGLAAWPVIMFSMEEFEAQGYKNFKPIFKVYGWLDDEQLPKLAEEDADIDALIEEASVGDMSPSLNKPEKNSAKAGSDPAEPEQKTQDSGGGSTRRRRRA